MYTLNKQALPSHYTQVKTCGKVKPVAPDLVDDIFNCWIAAVQPQTGIIGKAMSKPQERIKEGKVGTVARATVQNVTPSNCSSTIHNARVQDCTIIKIM